MELETLFKIAAVLIFVPLGIIVLLILGAKLKKKKVNNIVPSTNEIQETEWLNTIKELFVNNEAMDYSNILSKCGIPIETIFSEANKSVFNTYALAISNRYYLQKTPLQRINPSDYNLNLSSEETLYLRINLTTLYEEKVTQRNIAYSGMRWNNGLLRAGTLSLVSNEIRNFVPQDCGRIFITDKRIIFIGKQRNITKGILLKNIITYTLYKDGIMISQPNKKVLLFKFDSYNDDSIAIQDGLNEFIIVLSRILEGTEKDYFIEGSKLKQELIKKGYDEQLINAVYLIIGKDNITTSQLQRSLEIGYNRAGKILEQLAFIGIIDKPYNSKIIINNKDVLIERLNNANVYEKATSQYEIAENNRNNIDSCEREPNENEVKIPTKDFFEKYAEKTKGELGIRKAFIEAQNKGYNYFILTKEEFERIKHE